MPSSDIAVSEGTSLSTVICVLRSEDSSYVLGTKHLSDVGTYFTELEELRFSVEPYFMLYPSHDTTAFAFSEFSLPPLHQHASRFACHALHMAKGQPFHVPHR
jgi:hypothetical protein